MVLGTTRSLVLRREALAALADGELTEVVGGRYSMAGLTCPLLRCDVTGATCHSVPPC